MSHIYVFGASCSGKSTFAKALHHRLGIEYAYIDRDVLIENGICLEADANAILDQKIKSLAKVIIDAQIPWKAKEDNEVYILVYAPLSILLKRNEKRELQRQRTAERAVFAKKYVIQTHDQLAELKKIVPFDMILHSAKYSIQELIAKFDLLRSPAGIGASAQP